MLGFVVASSGCFGINPQEAAVIDDGIGRVGSVAQIGISPDAIPAIDSAALAGDLPLLHLLIAPGIRTKAEIARVGSAVVDLRKRWKTAR
jgi:hypothetical protein